VEREPAVPLGALLGRHVVGVCGSSAPGECIAHTAPAELRSLPATVGPAGDPSRAQWVWAQMVAHDLDERHWHLGPVGVDPSAQGRGVGGQMLAAFGARMDAEGEVAWLETDKPENVVFYRRHGFSVAAESTIDDFTTWFMRRDPR
jgi:ribosomal protein S18 acetylase RimI-like enzyme